MAHSTRPKRSWLSSQLWKLPQPAIFMRLKSPHRSCIWRCGKERISASTAATAIARVRMVDRTPGARLPPSACSFLKEPSHFNRIVAGVIHDSRAQRIRLTFGRSRELQQEAGGAQLCKLSKQIATRGDPGDHRGNLKQVRLRRLIRSMAQDHVRDSWR